MFLLLLFYFAMTNAGLVIKAAASRLQGKDRAQTVPQASVALTWHSTRLVFCENDLYL